MENPPKKFFRLGPGREVRLRYAYYITCQNVVKDEKGNVIEIHCTYDPKTKGGQSSDGRKVKGTIHWVSTRHAINAEVRLYDRLFNIPDPSIEKDFKKALNPDSLTTLENCKLEPDLQNASIGESYQFERLGYFCKDQDSKEKPIFNRTVPLRDSWARLEKQRNMINNNTIENGK